MKLLITMLSAFILLAPELSRFRMLYKLAAEDEKACTELAQVTEKDGSAIAKGYHGAAQMMMAKHLINPASKLSYFNSGKKHLENAISAESTNTELRFLRFCIQCETPSFLGYKDELLNDKLHLLNALPTLKDKELKQMIISYMKHSDQLSAAEKSRLK